MSQPSSFLDRAGAWFLHSGIQEPGGGVARYYRSDLGANARVSTEITGYAVSALAYLHSRTCETPYLDAAVRAARFLTRTAWDASLEIFPFEVESDGARPPAYFFDSGIIARGLVAAWRSTGLTEFLDAAQACCRSMARDFPAAGGFHPVLALPSRQPWPWEPRWSRSPGCYQLKAAMAWHEVYDETKEEDALRQWERALALALSSNEPFLPGETSRERVMDRLHAYCYFLEGLLISPESAECRRALEAGIARAAALLREIAPAFERSDVCAQLLRVRLYADALGAVPLDRAAAEEEASRAASYQLEGEDARIRGGFAFGRKDGRTLPYVNPVSTAFCIQALEMWRLYSEGAFGPRVQALI